MFRHFRPAALALILCGHFASAQTPTPAPVTPVVPAPAVVRVRADGRCWIVDNGGNGNGTADNRVAIQACLDNYPASIPLEIYFPRGDYYVSWPGVKVDRNNVTISGEGAAYSTIDGQFFGMYPLVTFGLNRVEAGGQKVGTEHRPSAAGVLDATAAGTFGYATLTDSCAVASWTPGSLGGKSLLAPGYWDYWGEQAAQTVEFCFSPGTGATTPLGGINFGPGFWGNPQPWHFSASGNNPTGLQIESKFATGYTRDSGTPYHTADVDFAGQTAPYRCRFTRDLQAGTQHFYCNGNELPIIGAPVPPGSRYLSQRGDARFGVGTDSSAGYTTPGAGNTFVLWGMRLSNAVRADSATDQLRYFTGDAQTLWWFGGGPATGRSLLWHEGNAVSGRMNEMWVHSTGAQKPGIQGCSVKDLTFASGSPGVALAGHLGFSIKDCDFTFGNVGLGSVPSQAGYPFAAEGCNFTGTDVGVHLEYNTVATLDRCNSEGARAATRFVSCDVTVNGGYSGYASAVTETCHDFFGAGYGGRFSVTDWTDDCENFHRPRFVRLDALPYQSTTLRMTGCASAGVSIAFAHVRNMTPTLNQPIGLYASVNNCPVGPTALLIEGASPHGTFDTSDMTPQAVSGTIAPGMNVITVPATIPIQARPAIRSADRRLKPRYVPAPIRKPTAAEAAARPYR